MTNTLKTKRVSVVLKVSEDASDVTLKWVVTDEFHVIWAQKKCLPNRGAPWVGFSLFYKGNPCEQQCR